MNFLKRGFTSIFRKPGKSLILLALIFVLCNVIAGAISVKDAIKNTQKVLNDKIGVEVTVGLDQEAIIKNSVDKEALLRLPSITPETVKKIGSSQYVKSYDYYTQLWLNSDSLSNYVPQNGGGLVIKSRGAGAMDSNLSFFQITGGQNPEITDFQQGKATLYEGRTFTAEEINGNAKVALISKNAAEKNNVSVGSVLKFKRDIYKVGEKGVEKEVNPTVAKTLEFEFTVIGIFTPKEEVVTGQDGQVQVLPSALENTLYASNNAINDCNTKITVADSEVNGAENVYSFNNITPSFFLKNPEDLDLFKAEQRSNLPKNYIFSDNSEEYKSLTTPMSNMEWIAQIVLYVSIAATVLILSLLITLFLRDRKHEMGIYLSLGEKKLNIASQVLIEVLTVALIAITLSVFSGNMLAKGMSKEMLKNQITAEEKNNNNSNMMNRGNGKVIMIQGGVGGVTNINSKANSQQLLDSYKVDLSFGTILIIYLVGIGTVLISTLLPISYTLRLNPKKILM